MKLFRSKTVLVSMALVAFMSSACVSKGDSGVKMNALEANLVFGVKPPAAATPLASDLNPDLVDDIDIATELTLPPPIAGFDIASQPVKKDCPEAPLTAGVDRAADVGITGPPLVGVSRWKHSGFLTLSGSKVPYTGFERRVVRNFKQVSPSISTFETLQPTLTANGALFLLSTFRVRTDGTTVNVNPPVGQGVPAPPKAREADAGVVLTSIRTIDKSGSTVGTPFEPVQGILLLPLPVDAGGSWQSVAVDPKSGQTVTHRATLDRRQRIDACGDLVDGWHVISTQVIASGRDASPQADANGYDYIVATQYGGMLIDERIYEADSSGGGEGSAPPSFDLDTTLAQLRPDPLPAS